MSEYPLLKNFRTEAIEFIQRNQYISPNEKIPEKSSKEVHLALQLSKLVYEDLDSNEIQDKLSSLGEFDIVHGYQVLSYGSNLIAGVALIAMNSDFIFLAIRGSLTTRDFELNLSPTFSYESLGQKESFFWIKSGFYARFNCFRTGVNQLKKFAKEKKKRLVFCGHSLGGAVAFLCGIHSMIPEDGNDDYEKYIKIITFGQPLVFRKDNTKELDKLLDIRKHQMILFMNERDIVPEITIARNFIPLSTTIIVFLSSILGSNVLKSYNVGNLSNQKDIMYYSLLSGFLNFVTLNIFEKSVIPEFKLEPEGIRIMLSNTSESVFSVENRNIFFNLSTFIHLLHKNIQPHSILTYEKNLQKYQCPKGKIDSMEYSYKEWATRDDFKNPQRKSDDVTKSFDEVESSFYGISTTLGMVSLSGVVMVASYHLFNFVKSKYFNK